MGMAKLIEYDQILDNSYNVIDLLKKDDLYITKFTLNRILYNDIESIINDDINTKTMIWYTVSKLDRIFNNYSVNGLYLEKLVDDKYFIEEKEIDGNMVKVYDTPFGHKLMVIDTMLGNNEVAKKLDLTVLNKNDTQALFFTLIIFIGICYLFYYLIK
ncbi:hypothetical protein A9K75_06745 [Campylobacter fetus subsp. testudinum]|uniref:hypothetical protein n=1 Tax=Campylobacter fetus TaxID=196 RepID=UPI000818BDAE|nr:hypothetical protein [Campylobacter fetus]OCR99563.1 hypothetical protein A9K75_06745 [Campylobacter fetus subsp. testudinum]